MISLCYKVSPHFVNDNVDKLFFGKKFIQYPDSSTHLHVELISNSIYYCGEEKVDDFVIDVTQNVIHIPDDVQAWTYCTEFSSAFSYASGAEASYSIYQGLEGSKDIKILFSGFR